MLPWIVFPRTSSSGFFYICQYCFVIGYAVYSKASAHYFGDNNPCFITTKLSLKDMAFPPFFLLVALTYFAFYGCEHKNAKIQKNACFPMVLRYFASCCLSNNCAVKFNNMLILLLVL